MKRREFITLLGGAAAWPLGAHAQQRERMRRIGLLMNLAADDPESMARIGAFLHGLHQLGWVDGRNVVIHYRWGAGDSERIRKSAQELVALAPDVILAVGAITVSPLQQVSRAVPIVFANVTDPVGAGVVPNLARPGGNITGFTNFEYGISGKWLELLKELVPNLRRAAVLRDPTNHRLHQPVCLDSIDRAFPERRAVADRHTRGWRHRTFSCWLRARSEFRADRRDRHLGDYAS